ncbi:hypothetical protein JKF63_02032 [Porcisia hertigi]|uniref:Tetraspanin n=1 Tax=Porcisia hertigi TaxID=2761500 RepID=A0A836IGN5_9TRYP|nr:hypothetical protein JKF63_02032 [Porcisia hertigi]
MNILDSTRLLAEQEEPDAPGAGAAMEVEEDDIDWVNYVYRQLNSVPNRRENGSGQRRDKYRAVLGAASCILGLFGVGVLVWLFGCFSSPQSSLGVTCTNSRILLLAVGLLILLTGIFGCAASFCFKRSSLTMCLAALFLFYAVVCGASATCLIYLRLRDFNELHRVWASMVAAHLGLVCDIQKKLRCAGFKKGECCRGVALDEGVHKGAVLGLTACYLEATNGTTFDIDTGAEVDWPRRMCSSQCWAENAMYEPTCEAPLTSLLRSEFYRLLIWPLSCTIFFLLLTGIAVASVLWKPRANKRRMHRF